MENDLMAVLFQLFKQSPSLAVLGLIAWQSITKINAAVGRLENKLEAIRDELARIDRQVKTDSELLTMIRGEVNQHAAECRKINDGGHRR